MKPIPHPVNDDPLADYEKPDPARGGARPGAGRKRKGKGKRVQFSHRVAPDTADRIFSEAQRRDPPTSCSEIIDELAQTLKPASKVWPGRLGGTRKQSRRGRVM